MEESSRRFREEVGAERSLVHHQIAYITHNINLEKTAKSKSQKPPN
jgi:hypothetical protein